MLSTIIIDEGHCCVTRTKLLLKVYTLSEVLLVLFDTFSTNLSV
jgi:hypothetical protein